MKRILLWVGLILVPVVFGLSATTAQAPPFATNTPQPIVSSPTLPERDYGLRRWQENDLIALLQTRIQQVSPGADQFAVRLLQHELAQRFPGAPHDPAVRANLLRILLNAPPGNVDMRFVAQPYIIDVLNELAPTLDGLQIDVLPASIDLMGLFRAITVEYRNPAGDLIYQDYLLARVDDQKRYTLLPTTHLLPAAPLDAVHSLTLVQIADYNGDSTQELAVIAETDAVNDQLYLVGVRNGEAASLVEPGQAIIFGELMNLEVGHIETDQYRVESPAWDCLGEQAIAWNWERNFFRPTPSADGFFFQSNPSCLFYGLEPYFNMPANDAIAKLDSVLSLNPPDDPAVQRARMLRAVLTLLAGDTNAAGAQVLELADAAEPGSWLAEQTHAFLSATAQPDVKPLRVCMALATASDYGACDVEQLLQRLFTDTPLRRDQPINAQLASMGITVLDSFTVSTLGRADRQGVYFDLGGKGQWWAFATLDPDFYTAEILPEQASQLATPPTPLIVTTTTMRDSLLLNNNPGVVITLLQNLRQGSPNALIAADARYVEALSFDLLANREAALTRYYTLWRDWPQTIWGQLAAAHLQEG